MGEVYEHMFYQRPRGAEAAESTLLLQRTYPAGLSRLRAAGCPAGPICYARSASPRL